jgi:hypothetical protein
VPRGDPNFRSWLHFGHNWEGRPQSPQETCRHWGMWGTNYENCRHFKESFLLCNISSSKMLEPWPPWSFASNLFCFLLLPSSTIPVANQSHSSNQPLGFPTSLLSLEYPPITWGGGYSMWQTQFTLLSHKNVESAMSKFVDLIVSNSPFPLGLHWSKYFPENYSFKSQPYWRLS